MTYNNWPSQTDDWSNVTTAALPRVDADAATMARPAALSAFAWSNESPAQASNPEYSVTEPDTNTDSVMDTGSAVRTKRLPRAITLAGVGIGAAAALATALIVVFEPQPAAAKIAPPTAAIQTVTSAPTTPTAAPMNNAVSIAPTARSHASQSSTTAAPSHPCPPRPATSTSTSTSTSDESSQQQQPQYQWRPNDDWRSFLPHFDHSGSTFDPDSSSGRQQFGHHRFGAFGDEQR